MGGESKAEIKLKRTKDKKKRGREGRSNDTQNMRKKKRTKSRRSKFEGRPGTVSSARVREMETARV